MKCEKHEWDSEAYVVQCAASKRIMGGTFLIVVLVAGFVYYRQQEQKHLEKIQTINRGFARQNAQNAPPPLHTDAPAAGDQVQAQLAEDAAGSHANPEHQLTR